MLFWEEIEKQLKPSQKVLGMLRALMQMSFQEATGKSGAFGGSLEGKETSIPLISAKQSGAYKRPLVLFLAACHSNFHDFKFF